MEASNWNVDEEFLSRWLEDETDKNDNTTLSDEDSCAELAGSRDSRDLRNTMRLYGTLFLLILIVFCYVRRKYPKVYNLRNWLPGLQTPLAQDTRGTMEWMWKMFGIADIVMMDECGMDAVCYARVLEFGMKLAVVGIFNSLWLIPVYATAETSALTKCIDDWVVAISISHVPSGSKRFIAAVLAAYVIFGFAMYAILQEFVWFTRYRHLFLSKQMARNYAVYVQCIPKEYQTNQKLRLFFQQASGSTSTNEEDSVVLDAHLAVKAPILQKKVALRAQEVARLEHAINVDEIQGRVQMSGGIVARTTHGIRNNTYTNITSSNTPATSLTQELTCKVTTLNHEISQVIDSIYRRAQGIEQEDDSAIAAGVPIPYQETDSTSAGTSACFAPILENGAVVTDTSLNRPTTSYGGTQDHRTSSSSSKKLLGSASSLVSSSIKNSIHTAATAANAATSSAAGMARMLLDRQEDGQPHSAGFVTFKNLRAAQAAKQMLQYPEPFAMEVLEAPQPEGTSCHFCCGFVRFGSRRKSRSHSPPSIPNTNTHLTLGKNHPFFVVDVFWKNVGKTHEELALGKLLSFALTVVLCLFWTLPMGFISSLSSIKGLREQFNFVDTLLDELPGLEPVFAQLAPLLIILANNVLKIILEHLSGMEGPISGAVVSSKLFTKLSSFMIIQTFFVTTISGSIMDELSAMLNDTGRFVDLLAKSLPRQSTFFIQILIVDTCISMGVELLRVVPLVMALLRSMFGPRLTKKERETTWMGLRPLNDPSEFSHAEVLASTVLYFTVFFVYATLAPITTWFMLLCFTFLSVGYRHQFVYIYPTFPDSGGKLWVAFFKLLPSLMIMAQVTMLGVLALNKSAIASSMMIPLLLITVLFTFYINQQHFDLTEYLPAKDALMVDLRNKSNNHGGEVDFDFLKDKYIQPELRDREVWPENLNVEREIEHGCLAFSTPPGSEEEKNLANSNDPLIVRHDGTVKALNRV